MLKEKGIIKCVIYCRVSTLNQVYEGHGIETQEVLCKEWAIRHDLTIVEIYKDAGKTGKTTDNRDELLRMVRFLENSSEKFCVIFSDFKRLSREVTDFGVIRKKIEQKGHCIATIQDGVLDQSPKEHFTTTIKVAQGQYEREENAIRVKEFMVARAKQGYWQFPCPWGYKYLGHNYKKDMVAIPEIATIIQSAFSGYASNRFEKIKDVQTFVNQERRKLGLKDYTITQITNMLKQVIYTAYFPYPKWNISLQHWEHIEQIVDSNTFSQVQDKIKGRKRLYTSKYDKNNPAFPLKGYVVCPTCGYPLTGSFSTGHMGKKYGYYQCQTRGCPERKNMYISIDQMHKDFEDMFEHIGPNKNDIAFIRAMAIDIYHQHEKAANTEYDAKKQRLADITREINDLFDKYMKTQNENIRELCQKHIDSLTAEQQIIEQEMNMPRKQILPFDKAFEILSAFFESPLVIWRHSDLSLQRLVLNIYFSGKLVYDKNQKFRTPGLTPICGWFSDISGNKSNMVPVIRLELTTPSLRMRCSTN